jgi:toxin secretion/phage lysis holin
MPTPLTEQAQHWLAICASKVPMVSTLLILILLDIASGLCLACIKRSLNSTVSFRGMVRKAATLILVAVGLALEPLANGQPLANLIATAFVISEAISVVENLGASGVPLPQVLLGFLQKLHTGEKAKMQQKQPSKE